MTYEDSELYQMGVKLSDRLGHHANDESDWFDRLVDYWRTSDGVRLYAFELSDLGRRMVTLLSDGKTQSPIAVFDELEAALSADDADVTGLCMEFLEGLDGELLDIRENSPARFEHVRLTTRQLLGRRATQAWSKMRSFQ
jgi:hypothetical protein